MQTEPAASRTGNSVSIAPRKLSLALARRGKTFEQLKEASGVAMPTLYRIDGGGVVLLRTYARVCEALDGWPHQSAAAEMLDDLESAEPAGVSQ